MVTTMRPSLAAAIGAVMLVGCATAAPSNAPSVTALASAVESATAASASPSAMTVTASSIAAPSAPSGAITVLAGEGPIFRPSALEAAGGDFQLFVSSPPVDNDAQAVPHNLGIRAPGTLDVIARSDFVMPGESIVLAVSGLEPGTYQFVCEVLGHAGAGMVGTLTVGDG